MAVQEQGRLRVGGPDLGQGHRQVAAVDLAGLDVARVEPALDEAGALLDPLGVRGVVADQLLCQQLLIHDPRRLEDHRPPRQDQRSDEGGSAAFGDLDERLAAGALALGLLGRRRALLGLLEALLGVLEAVPELGDVELVGRAAPRRSAPGRGSRTPRASPRPGRSVSTSESDLCRRSSAGTQPGDHRDVVGEDPDLADRGPGREHLQLAGEHLALRRQDLAPRASSSPAMPTPRVASAVLALPRPRASSPCAPRPRRARARRPRPSRPSPRCR